jgi:hypothetical protein
VAEGATRDGGTAMTAFACLLSIALPATALMP